MSMPSSPISSIACLTLAGAWVAVAAGLAVILSAPVEDSGSAAVVAVERQSWSAGIHVMGIDPCTDELLDVEASLTVKVTTHAASGGADVELRLENQPSTGRAAGTGHAAGIEPLARRFAPYMTPVTGTPYVHTLRTPLASQHRAVDLVIDVHGVVDDRGAVSLSIAHPRIDGRRSPCQGSPPGPPDQPVTHRPRLSPDGLMGVAWHTA